MKFDYGIAFSRNIGLISQEEQDKVKKAKIGIAGVGAAGGATFYTLVRIGFSRFHIADIDEYELVNFNRQIGARLSTLGRKKTEAIEEFVRDINPDIEIKKFDNGINDDTIDAFLEGLDVVVDGIDYFSFSSRMLLYRRARERGIPVVCSAPLGFTAAWVVFTPDSMSWDNYFAFDLAEDNIDRAILFLIGFIPHLLPIHYVNLEEVKFGESKGPSIAPAVQICSATNSTEVLKFVLGRGKIYSAPYYQGFDVYMCKFIRGRLRNGNRSLFQRIKFWYVRERLKG